MRKSPSPNKHVRSGVKGQGPKPAAFGSAVNPAPGARKASAPNPTPAPRMGRGMSQTGWRPPSTSGQPSGPVQQPSVIGPNRGWASTQRRPQPPTGGPHG